MVARSKIAEAFVLIGVDDKALATGLAKAKASFEKSLGGMKAMADKAKWLLLAGAGGAGFAVKQAASFEYGMSRVKALTNATGKDFEALRKQAMQLGAATVFTANDAARAMSFFAQAGYKTQDIMAAMPGTLDLAAAGQLDVAQSADIVAKILAGMGVQATDVGRAVDVLTKAMTTSNTDLVQLGEAMKYVGPIALASGHSFEETTAALQILSNAGIQASMAGTTLRGVFSKLSGSNREANKVFRQLGVSMVDATGKARPLSEILDDLNRSMAGASETEKTAAMMTAFGERGGPGMAVLLAAGGAELASRHAALLNSQGTAARIAATQLDNLHGVLEQLKGAAETFAISLGSKMIPVLREWIAHLTNIINQAEQSPAAMQKLQSGLMGIGSGLTTVLAGKAALDVFSSLGMIFAAGAKSPLVLGIAALATEIGFLATAMARAKVTGEPFGEVVRKMMREMGIDVLNVAQDPGNMIAQEQARGERSIRESEPAARAAAAREDLKAARIDLAEAEADLALARSVGTMNQRSRIAALTRLREKYEGVGGFGVMPGQYAHGMENVVGRRRANVAAAEARLREAGGAEYAANVMAGILGQSGNEGTRAVMKLWEEEARQRWAEKHGLSAFSKLGGGTLGAVGKAFGNVLPSFDTMMESALAGGMGAARGAIGKMEARRRGGIERMDPMSFANAIQERVMPDEQTELERKQATLLESSLSVERAIRTELIGIGKKLGLG